MKQKLQFKEQLYIGMMVFGLFFGAGNLIFPIQMGQEAGADIWLANVGLLTTGIGLPFLGIIAFGISDSGSLMDLGSKIGRKYARILTTVLYLIIGPLFAMPRLASTSFEIGIAPFIDESNYQISLLLFTLFFFVFVWFFSRKPSKVLDYIGKWLTPLFLILLAIIIVLAFVKPMGTISEAKSLSIYQNHSFLEGFKIGYNTLDAIAALAFGTIIIESVKSLGIVKPKYVALEVSKAGLIGIFIMGVIYTLLSLMGAMSLGELPINTNGGITLAQIANHYLGNFGGVLLAAIVLIACVKTSIGLSTSFSTTFTDMYPRFNYLTYVTVSLIIALIIANVGLTRIIAISVPVLMFIYPLAITLILMSLFPKFFENNRIVCLSVTAMTLIASVIDTINVLPETIIRSHAGLLLIISVAERYIPLFTLGLSWVPCALTGFIIGLILKMVINNH
ncbi:branched-chain amino acid transport system II carrier protein [Vagococcus vulneris]|uniref:Branched-chain amino acid transport system carrier protein n=1 Tax=Vagococcus vulneris TaxID=1977869 RepID=A0A429ZYI6_9ENTE|nr:branched-chain amino acid transport system II carrier protein [Vagococcus vulneris]RST98993.1 branched-chain amino acid transport system II carrier protein [Vagococcus vulneris]